jgi:hypothetical protein
MPGAGGRDIHPRSTHGVLIRVYPNDSAVTGHHESAPPHLSGIVKVIVATADASLAANVYEGLGLEVGPVTHDEARGIAAVRCTAPKGGAIELVSAVDLDNPFAQEIERWVKEHNGGMYALVLDADDPLAAVASLHERGVATSDVAGRTAAVVFGTRLFIE